MRFLHLFIFIANFCIVFTTFGAIETFSNRRDGSSSPVFTTSSVYETFDDKYFEMSVNPFWSSDFTNYAVKNKVILGINPEIFQTAGFSGSVDVTITYKQWVSGAFVDVVIYRTLAVDYNTTPTTQIDDLSTATFTGGHHVKVEVTGVTGLNVADLYLETQIEVERYYTFDGIAVEGLLSTVTGASDEYIDFSWDTKVGAETYELEWVHVNDYTAVQNVYASANTLAFDFYLNSTRIEIKENHYRIPKIFNHGYLVYRVRAVGLMGADFDKRKDGAWDAIETGTIDLLASNHVYWIQTEFDLNMNWSHQVGYAEDGKRMEGLSFSDGLGRGRQSVVSNPVTNQVIVSNVYYDELGRGVITDLPTPVDNERMRHFMNFNLSNSSGTPPFSKEFFDNTAPNPDPCPVEGLGFSSTAGAGKYYSSANTSQEQANANIPDAETFPFNRVTYLNDFSGRVDRVSAAGETLSQGRGHETRFVYPSSSQYELDALFGSEVGLKTHYQKMITIDANGQVYVQYTDMAGRVVASYLMGPSPTNVDLIEGNMTETVENILMTNGEGQQHGSPIPSTTFEQVEYFAETSETYTFNYAFTPGQYQSSCLSESICFDCVYDLQFKIQDECGTIVVNQITPINGETFNTVCNTPGDYTFSHAYVLPQGLYTISKTLTVNRASADEYWCAYIDNSTCLEPVSTTFNALYLAEDFIDCDQQELYDEQDAYSGCDVSRELMLQDMSPGGQYGQYLVAANGTYSATSTLSILKTTGNEFSGNYTTATYLDQNSDPILVMNAAGNLVDPGDLTLIEFVTLFDPQWAEALLVYHPEYCYLEFCESNSASAAYDQTLLDTYTFSAACGLDYMVSPSGTIPSIIPYLTCSGTSVDPFFSGLGSAYATPMTNQMNSYQTLDGIVYYSMWQMAVVAASCPNAATNTEINTCLANFRLPEDTCLLDLVWVSFRSMYLEAKAGFVLSAQQASCNGATQTNECIGNPSTACATDPFNTSVSRFGNVIALFGTLPGDPAATIAAANAQADLICEQTCTNYANQWMTQFAGCDLSTYLDVLQLEALRLELAELCGLGCDLEHPLGATTAPPGVYTTNGNATINGVLEYHLGLVSVTFVETDFCSELLISTPGPYQTVQQVIGTPFMPLDVCACEAVLQAEYDLVNNPNLPLSVNTLEEVLAFNTGVSMQEANYLVCECDKVIDGQSFDPTNVQWVYGANAILAATGYEIPTELACASEAGCVDCETVNAAVTALGTRFSGITNFESSANYSVLLTNYLNQQFSFGLGYGNYYDFIQGCNAETTAPYCQTNPLVDQWTDMMTLVSMSGTLMNIEANKIDLLASNIVFEEGAFKYLTAGKYFWSDQSSGTLNLHYGLVADNCVISLTSSISGFDFSKIVSFGTVYTSTATQGCSSNPTFEVEVTYTSCGQLLTTILTGTSGCFDFLECECGDAEQVLCNVSNGPDQGICYQPQLDQLFNLALDHYLENVASEYADFVADYLAKCALAFDTEDLSYSGLTRSYQYTLFYYDQSGSLIRTVAPKGVNKLALSQSAAIAASRESVLSSTTYDPEVVPTHTYQTNYHYNSYNQLVQTTNPDQEGATQFWYDRYGRIVLSQNPVQLVNNLFSYSIYDVPGRPVEVGQLYSTTMLTDANLKLDDYGVYFQNWVRGKARSEVTYTKYDQTMSVAVYNKFSAGQNNLRLRVASVVQFDNIAINVVTMPLTGYVSAIHYSYDIHGNVVETLQDIPMMAAVEQDIKTTQYEFELISGNVKAVHYQKDKADQMTHEYIYDGLNRLTEVFTSTDKIHSSRQAHYRYYDYGPLARTELGQYKVQGMDFSYTINGWLKGMNSSLLNNSYEMGRDGRTGYLSSNNEVHELFAKDVAAYTLGYFTGDYKAIDVNSQMEASYFTPPSTHSAFSAAANNLYNGNIRSLVTSIEGMTTLGTAYRYDQLQRLKSMTAFEYVGNPQTTNDWFSSVSTQDYFNSYTYDKNGNIATLQRNGVSTTNLTMDNFGYILTTVGGQPSNRLGHVTDGVSSTSYTDDIDNQSSGNYTYDKLGQLTADVQEGISNMEWRFGDNKLKKMTKNVANESDLEFIYNPFGQRVVKINKTRTGTTLNPQVDWIYTYYAYDANGQVMATYDITLSTSDNIATLDEQHIYGAGRLGMIKPNKLLYDNGVVNYPPLNVNQNTIGQTYFEITNYLGNVNAVITDRKTYNTGGTSSFLAVVVSTADYYPFGMEMPGRTNNSGSYKYGYNSMEIDKEVSGNGNYYTTEFRQYDPRLGRWLSLDPMMAQFPSMSPYCAFDNNPVLYVDPLGLQSSTDGGKETRQERKVRELLERQTGYEGKDAPGEYRQERDGHHRWRDGEAYTQKEEGVTTIWTRKGNQRNGGWTTSSLKTEVLELKEVNISATSQSEINLTIEPYSKIEAKSDQLGGRFLEERPTYKAPYEMVFDRMALDERHNSPKHEGFDPLVDDRNAGREGGGYFWGSDEEQKNFATTTVEMSETPSQDKRGYEELTTKVVRYDTVKNKKNGVKYETSHRVTFFKRKLIGKPVQISSDTIRIK